ncbi:MAG: 30S ribosome-binding factor RbfA [Bacteroidales bacterium]|nr:30S ribosome-binding factor RbfA [Bacteroidales bacterium]
MQTERQQKIGRLLQKDLGDIILELSRKNSETALITVTKVHISSDLSMAKIYLSIYTTANKSEVLKSVQMQTKEIRFLLGNRIRHQLRIVPELQFFEDDTLDYIENIDKLLKQ